MTDKQLHDEILAELEFEPEVHPERIGVSVENGVVTLSGHVDSYSQKLAAERVVKRVYSVKALVPALEVSLPARDEVTDEELALAAHQAIAGLSGNLGEVVRITVQGGHVILEGEVERQFQRALAEEVVQRLRGVREVRNHIWISPAEAPADVPQQIEASLRRSLRDASGVNVQYSEGKVTLSGAVPTLGELEKAEQAAWRAAGVEMVEIGLVVGA